MQLVRARLLPCTKWLTRHARTEIYGCRNFFSFHSETIASFLIYFLKMLTFWEKYNSLWTFSLRMKYKNKVSLKCKEKFRFGSSHFFSPKELPTLPSPSPLPPYDQLQWKWKKKNVQKLESSLPPPPSFLFPIF